MSKKEKNLVIVTVILVLIMIAAFIYDRNSALLNRTVGYKLRDDMKIVSMNKQGLMFYRTSYAARIKISYDAPDEAMDMVFERLPYDGRALTYEEYQDFASQVFDNEKIVPSPMKDTYIWIQGVTTEDGQEILNILSCEAEGEAYLYVYYSR